MKSRGILKYHSCLPVRSAIIETNKVVMTMILSPPAWHPSSSSNNVASIHLASAHSVEVQYDPAFDKLFLCSLFRDQLCKRERHCPFQHSDVVVISKTGPRGVQERRERKTKETRCLKVSSLLHHRLVRVWIESQDDGLLGSNETRTVSLCLSPDSYAVGLGPTEKLVH